MLTPRCRICGLDGGDYPRCAARLAELRAEAGRLVARVDAALQGAITANLTHVDADGTPVADTPWAWEALRWAYAERGPEDGGTP